MPGEELFFQGEHFKENRNRENHGNENLRGIWKGIRNPGHKFQARELK